MLDNEKPVNSSAEQDTGHSSCTIRKLNERDPTFEFPSNAQLLKEEMVIAKHPLDEVPCYIPFRTAGDGRILITKKLLDKLYEKGPNEKVGAAFFVEVPVFEYADTDDWKDILQEFWKKEIGSFLEAIERIGVRKTFIVEPFFHINLNWEGIKTIFSISNIAYDVYMQEERDVEYEYHFDSTLPRFNLKTEEPAQLTDSVQLADLKIKWEFKRSDTKVDTILWILDSEVDYYHLNEEETMKVFPSYYEYSSDDDQFQTKQHVSNKDACKREYKHGTLMCKIASTIASRQTTIHFVKCRKLGNNEKRIESCLSYVLLKARELKIKRNVVLITLGSVRFQVTNPQSTLYILHEKLHKKDFLFICSAGNVKFPVNVTAPRPEITQYPVSFFANCLSCFVVGAHGRTSSKLACIPSSFGSCGCCTADRECTSDESFKQGVHTWSIGENVLVPKMKYQENDRLISGTSVATAVVAASITNFLNPMQKLYSDKIISKKLKRLMETSSDIFLCPKHGTRRSLIFNSKHCMVNLGYKRN